MADLCQGPDLSDGRVEPGETPREAAGRELLEETGLRADLLREPALAAVR
ncbi:NUDIX domain-containing protein [Streptomyces hydrogenans]